ncbi:MFS transporter [Phenylobacterium terrae]|uniref:MFS transporter n=1 Tax=Phenylobacterium terrae TaxID=2665495 RepID=A0ABW4N623_9CAUL
MGKPLSFWTMAAYGLGSASNGIKNRSFSAFLLLFYNQVMGLPPAAVGALMMIALAVDGLIDPAVGIASDHTRSRLGRRHPYMYASALPYGGLFCLLWTPPAGLSPSLLLIYLAVCLFGVRFFDTFFEVPASALAPEMTDDYDARTRLISFRYFFTFVGGLVLSLVAYRVFLRDTPAHPNGLFNPAGYAGYGLCAGLAIAAVILVSSWGTQHLIPRLYRPPAERLSASAFFRGVFGTLASRSLWVTAAAGVFASTAAGFSSGLSMYFHVYFWELTSAQLAWLVTAGFVASLAGVFCGPPVLKLFGKRRGAILALLAIMLVNITPVTLRLLDLLPPNGTPIVLAILIADTFLAGALNLVLSIAITAMIADLAEDAELRTGRRSEGLLVSADNFVKKTTAGMGIFSSSLVLAFVSFPEKARPGEVPAEVLRTLGLVFVPTLAVLYLAAVASVWFYGVSRQSHADNVARLKANRAAGGP